MISEVNKNAKVLWQKGPEDSVPEPAIIINIYSDCICLDQEGRTINIDYESIPELIKVLKSMKGE